MLNTTCYGSPFEVKFPYNVEMKAQHKNRARRMGWTEEASKSPMRRSAASLNVINVEYLIHPLRFLAKTLQGTDGRRLNIKEGRM